MSDSRSSLPPLSISIVLHTLLSRFFLLVLGMLFAVPFIAFHLIPRTILHRSAWFHRLLLLFYRLVLRASLLNITFEGLDTLTHLEPAIIVANHQSSIDIPVIGAALQGRKHIWMATKGLKKSFFYRVILPHFVIWVDMSSPVRGMRSLIEAMRSATATHQDIVIFPEGARQTSGNIAPFFNGFAVLAQKMNRPVVPIMIQGLYKVYPPGSFWIYSFPVTVSVGKPLRMQEDESPAAFAQRVQEWFVRK